jgi:hypothetical protein
VHIFGFGSGDVLSRAKYDQFFRPDYADLTVDPLSGTARTMATGRPPHTEADARLPVSYDATPYPERYQQLAARNQLTRGASSPFCCGVCLPFSRFARRVRGCRSATTQRPTRSATKRSLRATSSPAVRLRLLAR